MAGHLAERTTYKSSIHLGNSLDVLVSLKQGSIDVLLTDPPYGYDYVSRSTKLPLKRIANDKPISAIPLWRQVLRLVYPLLKEDGIGLAFTNWQCYNSMSVVLEEEGYEMKNVLIWEKNAFSRGDLKGNWGYSYEMVMYFKKKKTPSKLRRLLRGKREGNILKFDKVPSNWMKHPCLPTGELVFVDGKWQPIEQVKIGAQTNYGTVIGTSNHEAEAIVTITLEDGSTTRATENHPFLVAREGNIYWTEARHLTTQDEILTLEWIHSTLKPTCARREQDQSPQKDILESRGRNTVAPGWNITSSGKKQTEDQSQKAIKSITETRTSKIIELRISNLSIPLHTNGITLVQEGYQTDSGKSSARTVAFGRSLSQSSGTTKTKEDGQLEDYVSPATASELPKFARFSLRKVGSLRNIQTREEKVYNLTIQGIPAFDTLVGVSHNTEKPTALLKHLIEKTSDPGHVILDPFAGACGVLVAAQQTNRKAICIEIEREWAKVGSERTGIPITES